MVADICGRQQVAAQQRQLHSRPGRVVQPGACHRVVRLSQVQRQQVSQTKKCNYTHSPAPTTHLRFLHVPQLWLPFTAAQRRPAGGYRQAGAAAPAAERSGWPAASAGLCCRQRRQRRQQLAGAGAGAGPSNGGSSASFDARGARQRARRFALRAPAVRAAVRSGLRAVSCSLSGAGAALGGRTSAGGESSLSVVFHSSPEPAVPHHVCELRGSP